MQYIQRSTYYIDIAFYALTESKMNADEQDSLFTTKLAQDVSVHAAGFIPL